MHRPRMKPIPISKTREANDLTGWQYLQPQGLVLVFGPARHGPFAFKRFPRAAPLFTAWSSVFEYFSDYAEHAWRLPEFALEAL